VAIAPEDGRAEALAGLFLGGYIGLAVPIIGLGVTLQLTTPRVGLLGFAVALTALAAVAARTLLADERPRPQRLAPAPC
jgi:hypothetical protein